MRRLLYLLVCTAALMLLYSCKTNEKNMNDAYVKAMAGREADDIGLDSTVYSQIRREMHRGEMTVGGETVDVSTQWVRPTDGGGGINESIKAYCVVVGQFKQLFNAKSMRERLVDNGYPGAFVVETREPYYFVVVASYTDASEAVKMLKHTLSDESLKMKSPLPFILQPAQHR